MCLSGSFHNWCRGRVGFSLFVTSQERGVTKMMEKPCGDNNVHFTFRVIRHEACHGRAQSSNGARHS